MNDRGVITCLEDGGRFAPDHEGRLEANKGPRGAYRRMTGAAAAVFVPLPAAFLSSLDDDSRGCVPVNSGVDASGTPIPGPIGTGPDRLRSSVRHETANAGRETAI